MIINRYITKFRKTKLITKQIENKEFTIMNDDKKVAQIETQNVSAKVINIRSAKKAQEKASAELMDYMIWTMKHDMDPHRLYDDPIAVFRDEIRATQFVA